jgi:hypothetical protein
MTATPVKPLRLVILVVPYVSHLTGDHLALRPARGAHSGGSPSSGQPLLMEEDAPKSASGDQASKAGSEVPTEAKSNY